MRTHHLLVLSLLIGCQTQGAAPAVDDAPYPVVAADDAVSHEVIEETSHEAMVALAERWQADLQWDLRRTQVDALGMGHARYQQLFDGIPVFGGEAIVHLDETGLPQSTTDDLLRALSVDTRPTVDPDQAIDDVVRATYGWHALTGEPSAELFVLRHEGRDHLAYKVVVERMDGTEHTAKREVFVDAHTGEQVLSYSGLHTASGTSLYNGTVSFGSASSGGTYYLEDTSSNIGTYTYNNTTTSLYYVTDTDDNWQDAADIEAVSAHWALGETLDYYDSAHGRSGIDGSDGPGYIGSITGSGSTQSALVNYGTNYVNAFWDGDKLVFGDGDGSQSDALTTLDITAHEATHGVIEHEANLTYYGESGALNESFADVFGVLVETSVLGAGADRWDIGEDCWTPATSGDALRYMDDPTADGSSRDHYSTRYVGSADSGGVHINSGIGNLAFYLLVEGGVHPTASKSLGTVTGIGATDAGKIYYLALTSYMTASTNFAGARTATISASTALFGASSTQTDAVKNAWAEVGVGSRASGGGGGGGGFCSGYDATYTGTLSGTGASAVQPGGTYYYAGSGTHEGCLDGPASADYDLYLYKWQRSRWRVVKSAETGSADETATYTGGSGYYEWVVSSYSGSGAYAFQLTTP